MRILDGYSAEYAEYLNMAVASWEIYNNGIRGWGSKEFANSLISEVYFLSQNISIKLIHIFFRSAIQGDMRSLLERCLRYPFIDDEFCRRIFKSIAVQVSIETMHCKCHHSSHNH